MKSSSRNMPVLAALIGQVAWADTHGMDEASMLQMPVVEKDLVVDTSDCRCPGYVQDECEADYAYAQGCRWSDAGESNAPWCQCLGEPIVVLCCEAQTVECVACKLEIEVDDFDSTCCSASADMNLCQNEGVLYIAADGLTRDPALLGTTIYSRNGLTCTMTSFDSFPHDEPEPNPEYGQPCTETTATINGVPVCTIASNDGNSDPWVLFGDINDQISNFVASHFTNSATTSGLHRGDSVQVGTFSAGYIGQAGYSLDIGQFCSGGSCNDNFDLMIQFGTADVFSHSENGYRTTNGGFINNDHTAQGVVIGEHGMFGSQADHPNGYYATYCAYNGGCTANGNDFWSFSTHGVYPNAPSSIVCGMYYADAVSPWKECPSGDNGHRMRYYIRSSDLPVSSIGEPAEDEYPIQTSWALPSSWTIEASSSWDGNYGPDNVKEHSGRPWHSREDFPQHLIFDAGEVVAVNALATSQPPSGWSGSAMRGYTLFRSDNGEDWSEVTAGEGRNLAGGERQEIEFPVASARYWKLQIAGNHGYHRLVTTQYVEFRIAEPAVRPPSGEAEYVGCFVDDRSRDLGAMVGNTGASTNSFARCRERCGESIYMSLQFGGECFCADAYGTAPQYVMVDDAQCDSTRVPCSLNSHNCGGTWRQAIYMINPQCGGVYEAEDATHLVGATVHRQTDSVAHQGFTGQSFVDYTDAVGSVEWNVEHCGAGAASVSFRYALRGGDRPLEVEVNGEVVRAQLSFPPTGSWATWGRTDQVHIPLAAGANRIKLIGTGRSGANVDSMTLTTGTCADQGRYIRHDVGTAIYWEKCGVKYWVQSCSMCDNILDFAHTPCHNHWVDQPQSYIDSLLSGGGFGSADGERFQCSQHWAYNTEPTHDLTEPTHYLTVVSWPAYAWGEWNDDAKGPIQKCSPRDTTTDADGTGYMFTSCCTAEGVGMRRDCGTTHNTNFETAVEQCAAQGGRLCTADEVLSLDENSGRMTTVTQGCSVDGPRTASGGDLNRLWTSTPCSPCYTAVHDGHCATGWIRGSNTMRDSIESCFAQCDSIADCGYFAFSENSGTATNCALYTAAGGCEDDNNYPTYTAYQMSGGDCRRPDFPVLLDPKH